MIRAQVRLKMMPDKPADDERRRDDRQAKTDGCAPHTWTTSTSVSDVTDL
jgi:hypothetical protein